MRPFRLLAAGLAAALLAPVVAPGLASAQDLVRGRDYFVQQRGEGLRVTVRPRSWLDAGNVVAPQTYANNPATNPRLITASVLNLPPYIGFRDAFGYGSLPDPITNGPFVGARNIFGPVDYSVFDPPRD